MYWYQPTPFVQDKAILRSAEYDSVTSVVIDATYVGLNSTNVKAVPAGLFLAQVNGVNRYLPRDYTTSAVTTSQNTIPVKMPELFLAGDEILAQERLATLTLGGTLVAADVIYVTYQGQSVRYVLTSGTAATEATGLASALKASGLADYFRFEDAGSGVVNIYTTLNGNAELDVQIVSTSGTAVVSAFGERAVVGTVSVVDNENSRLTLTANAAVALDMGAIVGPAVEKIHGLNIHSQDYTYKGAFHLNAITGAKGVYKNALPYVDNSLMELFPKLHIA